MTACSPSLLPPLPPRLPLSWWWPPRPPALERVGWGGGGEEGEVGARWRWAGGARGGARTGGGGGGAVILFRGSGGRGGGGGGEGGDRLSERGVVYAERGDVVLKRLGGCPVLLPD